MGCCGTKKQPNTQQLPKEKIVTEPHQPTQPHPQIEIEVQQGNVLPEQPEEVRADAPEAPEPPPPPQETEEEKQKKLFQSFLEKEKLRHQQLTNNANKIPINQEKNNIQTYIFQEKCQDLDDAKLTIIDSTMKDNNKQKKDIFEGLSENELKKLDLNLQRVTPQQQILEIGLAQTSSYIQKLDDINYHVRVLRGVRHGDVIQILTEIQNKQVQRADLKLWKYYQRFRVDMYGSNQSYGDLYLYSQLEKENLYQFAANTKYTIQERLNLVSSLIQRLHFIYENQENPNLKKSFISPNNFFVRQILKPSQSEIKNDQQDLFDILLSDWQFSNPKLEKYIDIKKQMAKVQRGYAPQPFYDDNLIGFNMKNQNDNIEYYIFQLALLVVFRIDLSFDKNLSLDEKKANIYGIEDVFKYKIREAQNLNNSALTEASKHNYLRDEFSDYINKENLQSVRQFIKETFDQHYLLAWNEIYDSLLNKNTRKTEFKKETLRITLLETQKKVSSSIEQEIQQTKQKLLQSQSPAKRVQQSGNNLNQPSDRQEREKAPVSESQIDLQKKSSKVYKHGEN
ncbi:hypothetical protein pb186bvf_005242 [Paramecium bursaria]